MFNQLKVMLGAVLLAFSFSTFAENSATTSNTATLETLRADVTSLRAKLEKTQNLIDIANDKSYRDPKGMKRAHWRKLVGQWQRQIDATEARIAAHPAQSKHDIDG